jgi:hypothetical protein
MEFAVTNGCHGRPGQTRSRGIWASKTHDALAELFLDFDTLTLQETEKNTFKLSYYTPPDLDHRRLIEKMQGRPTALGVHTSLI